MLPIYFYLEPEILDEPFLEGVEEITIVYRFFRSKMQDMAKFAEEELKRVERNKQILAEMRRKKELNQKSGETTDIAREKSSPVLDTKAITGSEDEVYEETRQVNAAGS